MTPEGLEPPALGFGILRAAIAPWRREPGRAGRDHSWVLRFQPEKKKSFVFKKKFYLTPEGFEPPALGFGIPRAAIAPWRRGGLGSTSRSCTRPSQKKKKKLKLKKKKELFNS